MSGNLSLREVLERAAISAGVHSDPEANTYVELTLGPVAARYGIDLNGLSEERVYVPVSMHPGIVRRSPIVLEGVRLPSGIVVSETVAREAGIAAQRYSNGASYRWERTA